MTAVIIIHALVCVLLIILVLIQRGRGGGLVDSFSSVESMFGTNTNAFLTRVTTILSVVFFFTCLTLAILSARQSKSLLSNIKNDSIAVQKERKQENKPSVNTTTPVASEQKAQEKQ